MISCPEGVIAGKLMTKNVRQTLYGKIDGGSGSRKPEIYQRSQIEFGTSVKCYKTHMRINKRTHVMIEKSHPMKYDDGYDYTEDFDGKQMIEEKQIFINLKSVVGTGGSQTRTLRDECYPFVEAQLLYLTKSQEPVYFANIFDGDEADKNMGKFKYLLELPDYAEVKKYVYVGDLQGYFTWVSK
jgi:hypothetical protein